MNKADSVQLAVFPDGRFEVTFWRGKEGRTFKRNRTCWRTQDGGVASAAWSMFLEEHRPHRFSPGYVSFAHYYRREMGL